MPASAVFMRKNGSFYTASSLKYVLHKQYVTVLEREEERDEYRERCRPSLVGIQFRWIWTSTAKHSGYARPRFVSGCLLSIWAGVRNAASVVSVHFDTHRFQQFSVISLILLSDTVHPSTDEERLTLLIHGIILRYHPSSLSFFSHSGEPEADNGVRKWKKKCQGVFFFSAHTQERDFVSDDGEDGLASRAAFIVGDDDPKLCVRTYDDDKRM